MPDRPARLEVQRRLLAWYATQARDLPWRRTRDPYAILVAEVMLQQTGVDRVIPKWHAWLEQFPNIKTLASASSADAIRAWQGLGYNMRALRLHSIARQVLAEHGGTLPADVAGLMQLRGVGRYTAGAVACFAYEQPVAMVDTNVRRVLSRVFGIEQTNVDRLADQVVPHEHAYPWNQALMDLGATVCKARKPSCLVCPLLGVCSGPSAPLPETKRTPASERFEQSSRYFRGRLIDTLRSVPSGESMLISDLIARVKKDQTHARIEGLVHGLVRDGLVTVDSDNTVRLPGA